MRSATVIEPTPRFDRAEFPPPTEAPRNRWHATGRHWFNAIFDAIARARTTIDVEFSVWKPGRLDVAINEALLRAVRRGCRVRVLLDAVGSAALGSLHFDDLRSAGALVRRFDPRGRWIRAGRDRRVMVCVDERVAFIGGPGLADEYAAQGPGPGCRTLGLEIRSPDLARAVDGSFQAMWTLASDGPTRSGDLRAALHLQRGRNWTLMHAGAGRGGRERRRWIERDLARWPRIDVLADRFAAPSTLVELLARRSIRTSVRIVVSALSSVPLAARATRHTLDSLAGSAVQVVRYLPGPLCARLIVAGDIVYVGSGGLDRAAASDFDTLLRIEDPQLAADARSVIDSIAAHGSEAQPAPLTPGERWRNRIAHLIFSRVGPVFGGDADP